jgi:hypothetical protein
VPTRLVSVVIDSPDPAGLAAWWAGALGWSTEQHDDETDVTPPPGLSAPDLVFVPVTDEKAVKNRLHLDLASGEDLGDQADIVARLLAAGARRADVGQADDVPWQVLADPEGNEFCVLEPRPEYADAGPVAADVDDALDPAALARFWQQAAGGLLVTKGPHATALRLGDEPGPWLEFVRTTDPHRVKDRVHLDVAPGPADAQAAEVARLLQAGAREIEVGQSDLPPDRVNWVVLADPEDNEFCVLSPR